MTPTREEAERMAREWCDAWNRRDLEVVLSHYAEEIELRSPLVAKRLGRADGTLRGKTELRGYFARGMTNSALRFEFEDVRIGVDAITVLYRRENGMRVSDTMELDGDGRAIRMIACYAGGESDV